MSWTWEHLRAAVTSLELPDDQYVVGVSGGMLANESVERVDEVDLLVSGDLYLELRRRGWVVDGRNGVLLCPTEDGLFVRAGDVSDTYDATITAMLAEAWRQDGIPLVSMEQVDERSIRRLLESPTDEDDVPLSWTWDRLRAVVSGLDLPEGQYVVGLAGGLLANESVEAVHEVALLVTDELYESLLQRGWASDETHEGDRWLQCLSERGLFVRAGDVSDTYRATIPDLIADAWREDGIPAVSMMRVDQAAARDIIASAAVD